jgi:hypothetical protein
VCRASGLPLLLLLLQSQPSQHPWLLMKKRMSLQAWTERGGNAPESLEVQADVTWITGMQCITRISMRVTLLQL